MQTGPSVLRESRAPLEFEGRTEPLDSKERGDLQAWQAPLERLETPARMVLRVQMGLQDLPVSRDSEASWVSPASEAKEAWWDCQVPLDHQENQDPLDLKEAQVPLLGLVYQVPPVQKETLALRVLPGQRGPLVLTVS